MILKELIEDRYVYYEVSEEECQRMVETDYLQRLQELPSQAHLIRRRTPQEIMNEMNYIEKLNVRRETRHIGQVSVRNSKTQEQEVSDGTDSLIDTEGQRRRDEREALISLQQEISEILSPAEVEMIMDIYVYQQLKVFELAKKLGVSPNTLSKRLRRATNKLKKFWHPIVL